MKRFNTKNWNKTRLKPDDFEKQMQALENLKFEKKKRKMKRRKDV